MTGLSGTGSLSALGAFSGTASLSGVGTLSATWNVIKHYTASLSGTGTLIPLGAFGSFPVLSGTGMLTTKVTLIYFALLLGSGSLNVLMGALPAQLAAAMVQSKLHVSATQINLLKATASVNKLIAEVSLT